jgi:hypothetical protein
MLPLATATSTLAPYALALAVGFAVGIAGHVTRSRLLILTGILIVGTVAVYFTFVVGKLR